MMFNRSQRDPQGLGMTSQRARDRLVERLRSEPTLDRRVLEVIRTVPRHLYVDEALESRAYEDTALPIGLGQTISQPWVVARMTSALLVEPLPKKVLEIGTGSGYQAAVLAALFEQVYSVERIDKLSREARRRFRHQGIANVGLRHGDGKLGWPEKAPFDAIMITAAGDEIPAGLVEQLAIGGVLVAPVGPPGAQNLVRIRRGEDGTTTREVLESVAFVPLLGGVA